MLARVLSIHNTQHNSFLDYRHRLENNNVITFKFKAFFCGKYHTFDFGIWYSWLCLFLKQQAAAALQQQAQVIPQPGIAIPTTLATTQVATVSYPAPRAASVQANQPKQRVFTGTITKLHDNFGFVDEDVFFQTRYTLVSSYVKSRFWALTQHSLCIEQNVCFITAVSKVQHQRWMIEFWLKPVLMQTCHSSGMQPEFKFCLIRV